MKLFQIAGIAVAAASLAACGGAANEDNAASENIAPETENLDLNATDLNAVSIDANTIVANDVTAENEADANAAETGTPNNLGSPRGARRRETGAAPLFYSRRKVRVTTIEVANGLSVLGRRLVPPLGDEVLARALRNDRRVSNRLHRDDSPALIDDQPEP